MISTRSVGLLIDTVVCLTLAKWETVSGRFGGYLNPDAATLRLNQRPAQVPPLLTTPRAAAVRRSDTFRSALIASLLATDAACFVLRSPFNQARQLFY